MKRATGESRFQLYDAIGTARALVDKGATVTVIYILDGFGRQVSATRSTVNLSPSRLRWSRDENVAAVNRRPGVTPLQTS